LLKRQEFSGRNIGVTEATVVGLEAGSPTVTVNTPRRWVDVTIEDGSDIPREAMSFARLGNMKDPDRQGGILLAGSGEDAPYNMVYEIGRASCRENELMGESTEHGAEKDKADQ